MGEEIYFGGNQWEHGWANLEEEEEAPGLRALASRNPSLQPFISFLDCHELFPPSRVLIGVVFTGQPPISRLQLLFRDLRGPLLSKLQ